MQLEQAKNITNSYVLTSNFALPLFEGLFNFNIFKFLTCRVSLKVDRYGALGLDGYAIPSNEPIQY